MSTSLRHTRPTPGPGAAGVAFLFIAFAILATLLIPQQSQAADMLICRKFDRESDKKGRTIHLHGKGVKFSGSDGNDTIYGTPNDDLLQGGNGHDRVYGMGGDDIVCGGTGHDKVFGGSGNDAVYGEEARDEVDGGPGDDYVLGGAENDRVTTWGDGLDFADGDYGKDVVVGGAGDQVFGGTLNDKLTVRLAPGETQSAAYMNGGYDDDRLYGSDFDDHMQGNIGDDKIYGRGGDDVIRGGGSNDDLFGGVGSDSIFGENNRDSMHGDDGDDELTGGEGRDGFWGDGGFDTCNWGRKSEKLNSCEREREAGGRVPAGLVTARDKGGGKPGGQSGSAPYITSDGYPFPDKFSRIAGFKTVREADGKGGMKVLDKDSSRREKPNVVALGTVHHARELDGAITSGNGHQRVEWAYTNTCSRDYSSPDVMRSTGNSSTTPVHFNIPMPPKHGPKCDVAIWGKIAKSKSKKSLTARILFR